MLTIYIGNESFPKTCKWSLWALVWSIGAMKRSISNALVSAICDSLHWTWIQLKIELAPYIEQIWRASLWLQRNRIVIPLLTASIIINKSLNHLLYRNLFPLLPILLMVTHWSESMGRPVSRCAKCCLSRTTTSPPFQQWSSTLCSNALWILGDLLLAFIIRTFFWFVPIKSDGLRTFFYINILNCIIAIKISLQKYLFKWSIRTLILVPWSFIIKYRAVKIKKMLKLESDL